MAWVLIKPQLVESARIVLPEDNEKIDAINIDNTETPLDELNSLFGIPLKLRWYYFCVYNNNEVSINDTKIQLPYNKDSEAGAMEIQINYKDNSSNKIYASVNNRTCNAIKITDVVGSLTVVYRKPSPSSFNPMFKVLSSDQIGGVAEIKQSSYVHTDKSYITYRNIWPESIFNLIVFIASWMVIVVTFCESIRIFKKINS